MGDGEETLEDLIAVLGYKGEMDAALPSGEDDTGSVCGVSAFVVVSLLPFCC
ncbi:hypothetical protein NEUTE1DRAFT_102445 [Neurospora tetrasperma FGSC 2508]|uniref:Uncharacterized protein n=1 Tax=Neurospora tetrasperma (strain FGSC 2508 / ATCC MYA-4615 / P0657) TaxID=510951 RepID=F8MRX6_NEUT8|nr:uncharacterized protein NEUTE1DRAFT_102445 [Neurospora tetrasperma FGSC 2508]EGO54970.1 hypothetical protein NEUTE1DRAFT_102445 [Neurospora tetrasperma FGSC 2508]EGZ69839.1 hypothetical protein NEUTE2DRAFT_132219 [Neurospora tetrasperma FGSC 2509]